MFYFDDVIFTRALSMSLSRRPDRSGPNPVLLEHSPEITERYFYTGAIWFQEGYFFVAIFIHTPCWIKAYYVLNLNSSWDAPSSSSSHLIHQSTLCCCSLSSFLTVWCLQYRNRRDSSHQVVVNYNKQRVSVEFPPLLFNLVVVARSYDRPRTPPVRSFVHSYIQGHMIFSLIFVLSGSSSSSNNYLTRKLFNKRPAHDKKRDRIIPNPPPRVFRSAMGLLFSTPSSFVCLSPVLSFSLIHRQRRRRQPRTVELSSSYYNHPQYYYAQAGAKVW